MTESAQVLKQSSLQVKTSLIALSQVLSWFENFKQSSMSLTEAKVIPTYFWQQCQLVLAEGFTNAVRHAHSTLSEETPIDLELYLFANLLELRIWDLGPPFDLTPFLANSLDAQNPEVEGGRGILLMKAIANQISYTRLADGRNCLVIRKNYTEHA